MRESVQKRCRRMLITCNNPQDKGFTADKIKETMQRWQTEYYCFCYETGEQGTNHFHLYIKFKYPQPVSTVSKAFANAHIDMVHNASSQENRDYIRKEGKYKDSEKAVTNHIETFFESGDCPSDSKEKPGHRTDLEEIDMMLEEGMSPAEILRDLPFSYRRYEKDMRSKFFAMRQKATPPVRKVTVYWHVGESGTGKSYTYTELCEKQGENNVYFLTDYETGGFDMYCGEPILFMDEFKGSMKFQQLLNYLDGYKIQVHCRYSNAMALWTEVHITSVYPPDEVYHFMVDSEKQERDRVTQLLRRINTIVYHYMDDGEYKSLSIPGTEYIDYNDLKSRRYAIGNGFCTVSNEDKVPFPPVIPEPEQLTISGDDDFLTINDSPLPWEDV